MQCNPPLTRYRMCLFSFVLVALTAIPGVAWGQAPVTVGEFVPSVFETPHPYTAIGDKQPTLIHSDTIQHLGATYIAVHFQGMRLAPEDYVIVRSPDNAQSWTYTGSGKGANRVIAKNGWYATHVKGDTAIVELFTTSGTSNRWGYRIDGYARGYNQQEINNFWLQGLGEIMNLPEPVYQKSLCGADDSRNAVCYQSSEPAIYNKSRAVARLTINGTGRCTGWLVGSEGHLITNEHCIGNANDANNTDYEFEAEANTCGQNCDFAGACRGQIQPSGTLVQVDAPLDYALVKLPDVVADAYGFLQLRGSGPQTGERIYIPQHPSGWGKRIAVASTHQQDTSGFPTITGLGEPSCGGSLPDAGYWADTRGGSSGSPVLGYGDHLVVALHHCRGNSPCTNNGGDPNRGVPIDFVINDLGSNLPPNSVPSGNQPPTAAFTFNCTGLTCSFNGSGSSDDNGITSYEWTFGDGAQGSGVTTQHTYAGAGTFSVRLRVFDAQGLSDDLVRSVTVSAQNQPPTAAFTFSCNGLTCSFNGSGSSDDNGVTSYQWFFGDGAQGAGVTTQHTYASAGTFSVRLRVFDAQGLSDDQVRSVTVNTQNQPPTASFTFNCNSLTCSFNGSGSSDDNGITSYEWTFGDGAQGSGVTTQHTYAASGTFSVRLRVFDAQGLSDDQVRSVTVDGGCSDTVLPNVSHQGSLPPYVWDNFTLQANASDNVGVVRVDFYRSPSGNLLCTDTTAPYECHLDANDFPTGNLTYRARAWDACDNFRITGTRSTQTVREPLGNLENPSDGSTIAGPAASITGWALDPDGVASVDVTVGGLPAGPAQSVTRNDVCNTIAVDDPDCPDVGWTADFDTTTLPNGTYPVRAVVTDGAGYSTTLGNGRTVIIDNQTVPPCVEDANTLCLRNDRFQVAAEFDNGGSVARAVPKDDQNGLFWFFSANNLEIGVKILGPDTQGYYWVFHGSLTSFDYDLIITDTFTGLQKTFHKPENSYCGGRDLQAFEDQMLLGPGAPEASRSGGVLLDANRYLSSGLSSGLNSELSSGLTYELGTELTRAPMPIGPFSVDPEGLTAGPGQNLTSCTANSTTLCLQTQRFQVRVLRSGVPQSAVGLTADTGSFWFFTADNTEVVVKVLEYLGDYWVFYGSLTDRDYSLEITDTVTGTTATYNNALGNYCGGVDFTTF
ncbi:MAG: PKD domain-containing protein [Acidobacteriota bacterium]